MNISPFQLVYDKEALLHINAKVKVKNLKKEYLKLRYNSKLDKTFHKKFQIKWERAFKTVE